jgi:DNA repair protein RadC
MKIKDILQEERPRERLINNGPKNLTNSDLLAIILRQGSKKDNVLELSQKIFNKYNLKTLSRMKWGSLKKILGIGEAKACQIIACFELGRRASAFKKEKKLKINSANDIAKIFLPELSLLKKEHCIGVYLDSRKRIIKKEIIFIGSLDASVIHPREIFQPAINESAAALILLHNHPSGDPTPSTDDIEITRQLISAGKVLGIEFLDHIIIGYNKYCSLREKGIFN